jgi:DNA-binding transcriptional ArsR family regulator
MVEPRPAYELLMSLMAVSDPLNRGASEMGDAWFERVVGAAGPELMHRIGELSAGCEWVFGNVLGLAIETPEPRDAQAFMSHLRALDDRTLHLALVGWTLRPFRRATPPEVIEAAIEGDQSARERFLATSFPDDHRWPAALRSLLGMRSRQAARLLREVISDWNDRVFRHEWPALQPAIERDAAEKRALLGVEPPSRVIDLATNGWDYVPEPGVTQVIIAPTVVQRPWVTTADHGDTRIFCTSVPDEVLASTSGEVPPPFLVRRLRALGDERRLRLLRRIVQGRVGLHELAAETGLPKTTLFHHLVALRAAGLIRLRDDAARQYSPHPRYSVRAEAIPDAFAALSAWLGLEELGSALPPRSPRKRRSS